MGRNIFESPNIVEIYKENGIDVPSLPECQDGLEMMMDQFEDHLTDIGKVWVRGGEKWGTFEQLDELETILFTMLDCIRHAKAHVALRDIQEWQKGNAKKVQ